ncbi:nucleoside deaminase [Halobacillus massiliensis]|uniref:nucleoside deaminase n=1 Tax=Halobacillus massiliensis TaxID=1926286 RepID=UPI0009E3A00D|nr:nucleoside deaminase [Halobacillus massiliensis]
MKEKHYLHQTVQLAIDSVRSGGGPFGAIVIGQDGHIIGTGQNIVTKANDPTAHAEIQAIRQACENLNTFDLSSCTLYASCEPCPMCLGAIYWAKIEKVYYTADQQQAAAGGFDDQFIYKELNKTPEERDLSFHSIDLDENNQPFEEWIDKDDKEQY